MDLKHEAKLRNNTTYLNEFLAIEEPGFLNYLNQNRLITSSKLEEYKVSVAYLGFHFGGGQNLSGKVGLFAPCFATRLLGGFGGMLPRENFKKWCNLVRFREYFVKKII